MWLTETGGIVELRTRDGRVSLPRDELRARASVSFAFEEAHAFASRVGRMYLYQWQADAEGRFDAGLIRPDGSSRPALEVVRTQLAAMAGPGRTPGATASAPGAPGRAPCGPRAGDGPRLGSRRRAPAVSDGRDAAVLLGGCGSRTPRSRP